MLGDLVRIQLLGDHDADLLVEGVIPEEHKMQQQLHTRKILTPLYHCATAHAASVLPSALLFFICEYGEVAGKFGRELLRQVREKDVVIMARLIQNTLQFCFSVYKTDRLLAICDQRDASKRYLDSSHEDEQDHKEGEEREGGEGEKKMIRERGHLHFVNVSKRIALLLGVQLSYETLVPMFEMMKVGMINDDE